MMMILTSTYIDYIISYSPLEILKMWSLDLCSSWVIIKSQIQNHHIEVAIPNVNFYYLICLSQTYSYLVQS